MTDGPTAFLRKAGRNFCMFYVYCMIIASSELLRLPGLKIVRAGRAIFKNAALVPESL